MSVDPLAALVKQATGAHSAIKGEVIQPLWSGYGEVVRFAVQGVPAASIGWGSRPESVASVVVKWVCPPAKQTHHPRGWDTEGSHQRKLQSYRVEMAWYEGLSHECTNLCRVPYCYGAYALKNQWVLVLEDLDASGFPLRRSELDRNELSLCLRWLAHFHARFLGRTPEGLWPEGSYWHLSTRPDEWAVMEDKALQAAAELIDRRLSAATYQTLIQGDAKVANFCFSHDGSNVAAVDFQYVGGGCGIKDVAYFLGSCLDEEQCEALEKTLLDDYFVQLGLAVSAQHKSVDLQALEQEWRQLYPVAWADFYRFLSGWKPGHWKMHSYSRRLAEQTLKTL